MMVLRGRMGRLAAEYQSKGLRDVIVVNSTSEERDDSQGTEINTEYIVAKRGTEYVRAVGEE